MENSSPRTDRSLLPRISTWVLIASGLLLAANVVAMYAGAVSNGATLDEPAHVYRLQGLLANGWYVKDQYVVNGEVTQEGAYVYGPVVSLIGHALNVVVGTEGWGTVSESASAYAVRHVVIATLGLLGLVAAASMARLLLRSWRWGVVAAATLSAVPVYIGHAMFNTKDLPVAAGYTVATLGAVALTRPGIAARRVKILAAGSLALGTWLAAGVHPAMLVGIGVSVAVALGVSWARTTSGDPAGHATMKTRVLVAGAGLAAGYVGLVAAYPKLFLRPDLLVLGILDSGHFPYHAKTLTAGIFTEAAAPPYYLPVWFAAQTPIVVSLLCLVAIGWFLRKQLLATTRVRARDGDLLAGTAVVLVQAIFLPWVAIAGGSTLYQGARQMLFVVPAMAMLATVGAWLLARWALQSERSMARSVVMAGLVVGLAVPTATSAALFPYEYTWFNAATALRPVDGNWTLDYEWASAREVLPKIDSIDGDRCALLQPNPSCNRHQLIPYHDTIGTDLTGDPLSPGEMWRVRYAGGVARADAPSVDFSIGRDCRPETAITRRLFWRQVTMSLIERCQQQPLRPDAS